MFNERVKVFKAWKETESALNKKREEKNKLELQRKLDRVPAVAQECTKVCDQILHTTFLLIISKTIKKEVKRRNKYC